MKRTIKIGIIGDFNAKNVTHVATNDGIAHAGETLDRRIEAVWLPTDERHDYGEFAGLFCSPGSPYKSLEGALKGIRYARENQVPFMGTCGGFQHMILEYARNVLGVATAAHAETDPAATDLFITPLSCSLVGKTMELKLVAGTRAAAIYEVAETNEAYYCNFGLNPGCEKELVEGGLVVSGRDGDGEVRIMELATHPFYLGTLFVPQARSVRGKPHPMVLDFCRKAASGWERE